MAFVKIDCGIIGSTIWMDMPARNVFLTALVTAELREFTSEIEELDIDTRIPTGYKAPAGWYGFVNYASSVLINRSMEGAHKFGHDIDWSAAGEEALRRLCSPERGSKDSSFEGRRLLFVGHGFVVLNYVRYRERDVTSAERSRRYRQRFKSRHAVASRDERDDTRDGSCGLGDKNGHVGDDFGHIGGDHHAVASRDAVTKRDASRSDTRSDTYRVTYTESRDKEEVPKTRQSKEKEKEPEESGKGGLGGKGNGIAKPNKALTTLSSYLADIEARNESFFRDYEPVWRFARSTGISDHMITLAAHAFRERYLNDDNFKRKMYINWRQAFLNSVKGNWFKLWAVDADGKVVLTTVGKLADKDPQHA